MMIKNHKGTESFYPNFYSKFAISLRTDMPNGDKLENTHALEQ